LPAMPAAPPSDKRTFRHHYWSLPEAIAWRRQVPPGCSKREALEELQDLLYAGAVECNAVAEGANPLWDNDRKAKFEEANRGELVILPKTLLEHELDLVLVDHRRPGVQDTCFIQWREARVLAFSDPRFNRDELIRAWVVLLDQRRAQPEPSSAPPPKPVPEAEAAAAESVQEALMREIEPLYLQRAKEHGIPTSSGGRRLPMKQSKRWPKIEADQEWGERQGATRTTMIKLREKCGTGGSGAFKIKPK
jgi:hypothetical protein